MWTDRLHGGNANKQIWHQSLDKILFPLNYPEFFNNTQHGQESKETGRNVNLDYSWKYLILNTLVPVLNQMATYE